MKKIYIAISIILASSILAQPGTEPQKSEPKITNYTRAKLLTIPPKFNQSFSKELKRDIEAINNELNPSTQRTIKILELQIKLYLFEKIKAIRDFLEKHNRLRVTGNVSLGGAIELSNKVTKSITSFRDQLTDQYKKILESIEDKLNNACSQDILNILFPLEAIKKAATDKVVDLNLAHNILKLANLNINHYLTNCYRLASLLIQFNINNTLTLENIKEFNALIRNTNLMYTTFISLYTTDPEQKEKYQKSLNGLKTISGNLIKQIHINFEKQLSETINELKKENKIQALQDIETKLNEQIGPQTDSDFKTIMEEAITQINQSQPTTEPSKSTTDLSILKQNLTGLSEHIPKGA